MAAPHRVRGPFPFCPNHILASNSRLEHVSPDSAFCSSEISNGNTWNPRASIRARVNEKDAGRITVSPKAKAFAACGSSGATSIHSKPDMQDASNHFRLASNVFRPRNVTADLRCKHPLTGTAVTV